MIVVMGATLAAVEGFQRRSNADRAQSRSEEGARVAIDKLARELRNGASSASGSNASIGRATATDFVFQAVDDSGAPAGQNVRRAQWGRYGRDTTIPQDGRIWRQTFRWTDAVAPALPFAAGCPDTGVGTREIVTAKLVNSAAEPLFAYEPALPAQPAAEDYAQITHVTLDLLVIADGIRQREPSRLTTGVYLRNQADPPRAAFEAVAGGHGRIYLNASPSSDSRGAALTYRWCEGDCKSAIGEGLTLQYAAPPGDHAITLTATNAAGLSDSVTRVVSVP